MKRSLSLALVLFLLTALLSGCAETDPLVGTWSGELNDAGHINDLLADAYGAQMANYWKIDEFSVSISMTFRKDGTYTQTVDTEKLAGSVEKLKQIFSTGLTEYLQDLIDDSGSSLTVGELSENMNLSVDALLDTAFSADTVASVAQDYTYEGHYKAENGRLYTSDSMQTDIDRNWYETYTLSGDTLTLLALCCNANGPEIDQSRYPISLTRPK